LRKILGIQFEEKITQRKKSKKAEKVLANKNIWVKKNFLDENKICLFFETFQISEVVTKICIKITEN